MGALEVPTRSFLRSTPLERRVGFCAASAFSVIYYLAPIHIVTAVVCALRSPASPGTWALWAPLVASLCVPSSLLPRVGDALFRTWAARQIPKYFRFEEYHELTDGAIAERTAVGDRYVFCFHPHGVFPFVATCSIIAACGCPGDAGSDAFTYAGSPGGDFPTAVASVLRRVPLLKDVVGLFGVMDPSAGAVAARIRAASCALYVGGLSELFLASPREERVVLSSRKGFVKLALRAGADLVPCYMFGNTTVLETLSAGPLAALSRKWGVSLTVFWGRYYLPLPRPVKLVYVRGTPLGLPHIPNPTDADVAKYHALYASRLLALFDAYKVKHPDYAHKTLHIE